MLSRSQGDGAQGRDDVAGHALWLQAPDLPVAPTLVRLASSSSGAPEGTPLTLTAQVLSLGAADRPATGQVSFAVDGSPIGARPLDGAGCAVLDGVRLRAGVHAVVAVYAGDAAHAAATSAPLPQAVTAAAAPVVLLVAARTGEHDEVVLEAELVDLGTGRLAEDATGELEFRAGQRRLGSVPLKAGRARLAVPAAPGKVVVGYAGDREHGPAEGTLP